MRIHVVLPYHLRTLARITGDGVDLELAEPVTLGQTLAALEREHPALRGTFRDPQTLQRRAFIRYFACKEDLSHEPLDTPLPAAVVRGEEPLMVIGAMAGG